MSIKAESFLRLLDMLYQIMDPWGCRSTYAPEVATHKVNDRELSYQTRASPCQSVPVRAVRAVRTVRAVRAVHATYLLLC